MEGAKQVVDAVLQDLSGRRGFRGVIEAMDLGMASELRDTLTLKVDALLRAGPASSEAPGPSLKVDKDIAVAALRDIASGRVPNTLVTDRIEAAKVLLGRV